jgi:hypothetical protein
MCVRPKSSAVARVLAEVAAGSESSAPMPVWTWTLTEGLRRGEGVVIAEPKPRAAS